MQFRASYQLISSIVFQTKVQSTTDLQLFGWFADERIRDRIDPPSYLQLDGFLTELLSAVWTACQTTLSFMQIRQSHLKWDGKCRKRREGIHVTPIWNTSSTLDFPLSRELAYKTHRERKARRGASWIQSSLFHLHFSPEISAVKELL